MLLRNYFKFKCFYKLLYLGETIVKLFLLRHSVTLIFHITIINIVILVAIHSEDILFL